MTLALQQGTATPDDTWIAMLDRYGPLPSDGALEQPAWFEIPLHSEGFYLYRGSPSQMIGIHDRAGFLPGIWWPNDRQWVFTADPDLPFAFLGCSPSVAAAIVTSAVLEAGFVDWHDDPF